MCCSLWSVHYNVQWCHCWQSFCIDTEYCCRSSIVSSSNMFYLSVFKVHIYIYVQCSKPLQEVNCTVPDKRPEWCHVIVAIRRRSRLNAGQQTSKGTLTRVKSTCACMFLMINSDFFVQSCLRSASDAFFETVFWFLVRSLFSLMLSCVVHRWKKRVFYKAFMLIYPQGCVFFQNATGLAFFFFCDAPQVKSCFCFFFLCCVLVQSSVMV